MPKISIIVPIYNAEKYLRRCIDSILAQTFTDFELLLVDDGSTDGSGVVCDEYITKEERIRVFHKKNGGVSSARNVGLDNAQGEWITFCDADDVVFPNWLEIFAQKFLCGQMVVQGFKASRPLIGKTALIYGFNYSGDVNEGVRILLEHNIFGYCFVKAFFRQIVESNHIRFHEDLFFCEDAVFVMEYLCEVETMVSVSDVGYCYKVPDFSKKYCNAENRLKSCLDLCRGSLRLNSQTTFDYHLPGCIDYFFDVCLKDIDAKKQLSATFALMLNEYTEQTSIKSRNRKFQILGMMQKVDKNLSVTSDILTFALQLYSRLSRKITNEKSR